MSQSTALQLEGMYALGKVLVCLRCLPRLERNLVLERAKILSDHGAEGSPQPGTTMPFGEAA